MRVFDPDQPEKTFIMEDGRVVEVTHLDREQGGRSEMTGLVENSGNYQEEKMEEKEEKKEEKKEEEGKADSGRNTDVAGETEEVKTGEN